MFVKELIFDDQNINWLEDNYYNEAFLDIKLSYLYELLLARGWLFLRDVQEYLGFPVTRDSIISGWTKDDSFAYALEQIDDEKINIILKVASEDIRNVFRD